MIRKVCIIEQCSHSSLKDIVFFFVGWRETCQSMVKKLSMVIHCSRDLDVPCSALHANDVRCHPPRPASHAHDTLTCSTPTAAPLVPGCPAARSPCCPSRLAQSCRPHWRRRSAGRLQPCCRRAAPRCSGPGRGVRSPCARRQRSRRRGCPAPTWSCRARCCRPRCCRATAQAPR